MNKIPNEVSARFADADGRRELIRMYGGSNTIFTGENADGEMIVVSFDAKTGIKLVTNQSNGWVRVNYYDKEGYAEGETFDGKWR